MQPATDYSARRLRSGLAGPLQMFFSPSFPLVLITLCGVSYVLAANLAAPEFGLWALVAMRAIRYARFEIWAAVGLALLVIAALPLAWLTLRQRETRRRRAVGEWIFGAILIAVVVGLRSIWSYDGSDQQVFIYSFLLFMGWNSVIQAVLSTLAIVVGREPEIATADPKLTKP